MGFLRDRKRKRLLAQDRLPDDVWARLVSEHPIFTHLDPAALDRLRDQASVLRLEKRFEAAKGAVLDDYARAVIAAQVCLPILELGLDWVDHWSTIVVVPRLFQGEQREVDDAGVVHEWVEEMGGESWDEGPLVVSWEDVEASGWGEGYSVVIHETAHKLDLTDGEMNGRPALHAGMEIERWESVMDTALAELRRRGGKWKKGRVDPYAAESRVELFAVGTETFFEEPAVLRRDYPEVYAELAAFYRQDPLARRGGGA